MLVLCGCLIAPLAGCNQPMTPNATITPAPSTTANPPQPSSNVPSYSKGVSLSRPSVLVGTNGWGPTEVYSALDSGSISYASLEGCFPAVDGRGNIYMLAFHYPWGCGDYPSSIDVYPPDAVGGTSIRSLRVGPGMKITSVTDLAVSPSGEIFINDGSGIAVFSATANGSDAPVRYIQWDGGGQAPLTPGYIAVDANDNLYVQNGESIAVFGPHDHGLVVPSRVISGPHTQLAAPGRMTTDGKGNLYVTAGSETYLGVGLLEFSNNASGDAVPLRYVYSTEMANFDGFLGVAVDSSGLIYIRATDPYCGAIFVFAADASGDTAPLRVIGGGCPNYDIDGTIALLS